MTVPSDRQYTVEHEWVQVDGERAVIGVTAHATEALGDVVYLELPAVGSTVTAGQPCGEIESTKSVSELFAPADGEVTEVNDAAVADPSLVNSDPYGTGWLFAVRVTGGPDLLDAPAYEALTGPGS